MSETEEVYAAEDAWEQYADGGHVAVGEETYVAEVLPRFSSIDDLSRWTSQAWQRFVAAGLAAGSAPRVRRHSGHRRASYSAHEHAIRLPEKTRGAWAYRAHLVLHEIAHATGHHGHDGNFRSALVRLVEAAGAPEQARLLAGLYAQRGVGAVPVDVADSTIAKLGKLLRQAEGATTEGERDAFLARAQEIASRDRVAIAVARAAQAKSEERAVPEWRTVVVGASPRERGRRDKIALLTAVGRANDCQVIYRPTSVEAQVLGYPEDLDVVETMFPSLLTQMVSACEAYLDGGAWRGQLGLRTDRTTGELVPAPQSKISARLAFYDGFVGGAREILTQARERARGEVVTQERVSGSTEIALREKELEVSHAFDRYKQQHGVRSASTYTRDLDSEAHLRGRVAGARADTGHRRSALPG